KISTASEDEVLGQLLKTARELVEGETGLSLITQTRRLRGDRWPGSGRLALFKYPVQASTTVVAYLPDGSAVNFDPQEFVVQYERRPQRVYMPPYAGSHTITGLEIDFRAGFGETGADVPDTLKQAILSLTAHLYETRALGPAKSAGAS